MKFCGACGARLGAGRPLAQDVEELRRRVRELTDAVPVLIWMSDPDGSRTFFNKPWLDFTGRSLAEEQGAGWIENVHPDDRAACRGAWNAAEPAAATERVRLEYRLRRADGRHRWMLDTGVPRLAPDGAFAGFIGSCVDVTERREAEARLRSLIENASDVISVIAPDGTILYESPSVERLLGWRPEDLLGRQILDYVHPDDVAEVARSMARRLADPSPVNPPTEFRVRARDGSWRVLAAMSRVTQDEAGTVTLVVNSRDITEQRALEEQLRQAQRLDSVGQLAGGIAHDFNNLLTVILGRAALLGRRLADDPVLRRHVSVVEDTAKRGSVLTQQLLTFGRKQMLEPRPLDLNTVVGGIVPLLERLIGEHVAITVDLHPRLDAVHGDRGTLEQVIVNLAMNARDAMPRGGRVTLSTANVELDEDFARGHGLAAPGPHALLAVSDTGVGMDAETRARIFEPFFTTKGPGRGTGLGLATVHGIVKQHRGAIVVESAPGAGSTFRVYLPRAGRPAESARPEAVAAAPGATTILLVEDEAGVRELAQSILEESGYTVLAAADPGEALDLLARHDGPIDLLLTDVVMPVMNGRELASRVQRQRPRTKVLFVSGYTDEVLGPFGVLDAGLALLPKPFTLASLTARVAEVLRGPSTA